MKTVVNNNIILYNIVYIYIYIYIMYFLLDILPSKMIFFMFENNFLTLIPKTEFVIMYYYILIENSCFLFKYHLKCNLLM